MTPRPRPKSALSIPFTLQTDGGPPLPGACIYLFGSRARDDARDDSDYDVLIVVRGRLGPGHTMEHRAYEALGGLGIANDVVIMTRERFAWLRAAAASPPASVEREGRLLYAA